MALQALLLTADEQVRDQLRSVLRDLGIGVEIYDRSAEAAERLRRKHFDVAVLDCDIPETADLIGQLRNSPSSSSAPLFLVGPADRSSEAFFAAQCDYLLQRPLTLEQTWRMLRSARRQMGFTMFRYFRVRIDAPALVLSSDGSTVEARTRDVGQNGVGLQAPLGLQRGQALGVRLDLPGCLIEGQAEVVWADDTGRAGLRFTAMSDECRSALEAWIARGMGEREFAFVFKSAQRIPTPALIPAPEPVS